MRLLTVTGILLVVGSVILFEFRRRQFRRFRRALGVVTDLTERHSDTDEHSGPTYTPTIVFSTEEGAQTSFVSSISTSHPPRIGEKIPVLYDQCDPTNAVIDRFFYRHLGEVIVLLFGLFATVFGLVGHWGPSSNE